MVFIVWCVPSRGGPLGCYARNIPGSSRDSLPCGRTRTLSPLLVVLHAKWFSSTSTIRSTCNMMQRQLKLRLNSTQEQTMQDWLWHLTGVWNWAIRKIEADAKDGIYYSQKAFR